LARASAPRAAVRSRAAVRRARAEPVLLIELFGLELSRPHLAPPARQVIPLSACHLVAHFGREHTAHSGRVLTATDWSRRCWMNVPAPPNTSPPCTTSALEIETTLAEVKVHQWAHP